MKKIILTFILIFSLSFFCGCKQSDEIKIKEDFILLSLDISSRGAVIQSIRFSVNSNYISSVSQSLAEELTFKRKLKEELGRLRSEFLFNFAYCYLANPNENFKINQGVILTEVEYNSQEDYMGFDIYFTSAEAWQYYHKRDDREENEGKKRGNIFINKSVSKGKFPFSGKINNNSESKLVGQVYKERFLSASKELSFEDKLKENYNPQFIYNYSSPNKILKSDANFNYRDINSKYHHIWIVEGENLNENNIITLSMTIINRGWWILLGTIIPLSIGGISILIVKIKQKK